MQKGIVAPAMSFKIHLIIVSVIIVIVYLVWGMTRSQPQTAALNQPDSYTITVIHASWGLNCPVVVSNENVLDKAYVKKSGNNPSQPYTDNALNIVADLCNGQSECTIALSDELFSGLAPENCNDKKLTVEYRCFAFDRPWRAEASTAQGLLAISCQDKKPK
jgi:hypothetical protein